MTNAPDFAPVLRFWFDEIKPAQWWSADPQFDLTVRNRFAQLHQAATRGELSAWRTHAGGRLAEVIVLDQFSRNMYRGTALAFAADPIALVLAQEAIAGGHDQSLAPDQRLFLYMPFMHSESALVHASAVPLFEALGLASNLAFELRHKAIIDRFGRYPHRNAALGRASTDEELRFLQEPGSHF
jgi:uncharacterized protein (DUF924 family)